MQMIHGDACLDSTESSLGMCKWGKCTQKFVEPVYLLQHWTITRTMRFISFVEFPGENSQSSICVRSFKSE